MEQLKPQKSKKGWVKALLTYLAASSLVVLILMVLIFSFPSPSPEESASFQAWEKEQLQKAADENKKQ